MKPILLIMMSVMFLFSLTSCVSVQSDKSSVSENQNAKLPANEIVNVHFCDLLKSPNDFEQKLIRFKAIYRYGFEWSEFYSLKCPTNQRTWVKATKNKCQNPGKVDEMDHAGMGGRTVGVIVVGRLIGTKGSYGHLNSYQYLFEVDCFERAEMLDREGYVPSSLTPEQRRRIEEFENY